MKKTTVIAMAFVVMVLVLGLSSYSCRSKNHDTWGTYAVYVTNSTSSETSGSIDQGTGLVGEGVASAVTGSDMSLFSQVTMTLTHIQLTDAEGGAVVELLNMPVMLDIANLENTMQLISVGVGPADSFNRLRIQFDRNTLVLSSPTGTPASCTFVSYKETGSSNQPNILLCDSVTNICTLNISGAVNLLAAEKNKIGLDFHLKDFEIINPGTPDCAITMKVSPLNSSNIKSLGYPEAITGMVSGLSTANKTFTLTRGNRKFTVFYTGITAANQPGLDLLLQRAQDDGLRARVFSPDIDFIANSLTASRLLVKVEGNVSNAATNSFSVVYGNAASIDIDSSGAIIEGIVTNGSWVDVKLYGYAAANDDFLANKVEVESQGMISED